MKEKEITAYEAIDGKIFTDAAKCKRYEEKIKSIQLWRVTHSPECTEGRGYYSITYLESNGAAKCEIEDFCYNHFGNKTSYIQGVQPIDSWILEGIKNPIEHKKSSAGAIHNTDYDVIRLTAGDDKKLGFKFSAKGVKAKT